MALGERRAEPKMDIVSIIIGVLGLIGTFFSIGYQIGKDSRQNKKDDETQK